MAGLFDDGGLKIPPMMGKAARSKLNKNGFYRMPPNLKGLPSAPKGGLGGAHTMGRNKKPQAFAEGGLAEKLIGEKAKQITGGLGSDNLVGTGADDWLTDTTPAEADTATPGDFSGAGLNTVPPAKGKGDDQTADLLKSARERIAQAQQNYMQQSQQAIAGMQAPKDTSMLAFASGLGKPNPTGGGFGTELLGALGDYRAAQNDHQKQMQDFNNLRLKLGMEGAAIPLQGAYKDAEMTQQLAEKQAQRDLMAGHYSAEEDIARQKLEAMKQKGNQDKINENADKANIKQGEQYQKTSDVSRELTEGLAQLEGILPRLPTSKATDELTNFDIFNFSDATKAKNEANKVINQIIIPKVKALGVNPSNRDLVFTQEAFVKSGSTPIANQRALYSGQLLAERMRDANNLWNDMYANPYYAQNPRELKGDFNKKLDELPSIAAQVEKKLPSEGSKQPAQAPTPETVIYDPVKKDFH
jgi:hypothetical protein